MKIVEFRIPIPLKLADYQRCSIHLLIEASIREMQGGSGLEVFRNEQFNSNDRIGYYTEKRYHLAKNLPNWLQSILGSRLTILTEKSWNLYPKLFTKYLNEVFPNAEFSLQTDNLETLTISENVLNLNLQDLNKRQVILVDLTKLNKLKIYDPKYDLTKVKAGNFLPLKNDWFKNTQNTGMVSYKLLRLNLPFFGMLSSKIESYIINFFYESLMYYTSMGLCSYDNWKNLSIEDLRETEKDCYSKLNEAFMTNYSKGNEKAVNLLPLNTKKGEEIQIPKEIASHSQDSRLGTAEAEESSEKKESREKEEVPEKKEEPGGLEGSAKEEVSREKESQEERVTESVRTLPSTLTHRAESVSPDFAEKEVISYPPGGDVTPKSPEMGGPVPVPQFDDSEFQDAIENIEDLMESDEEKGMNEQLVSALRFSRTYLSPSRDQPPSKPPSIDEATQVDLTSSDVPTAGVKLDEGHYSVDGRILSAASGDEAGKESVKSGDESIVSVELGASSPVKKKTGKIISTYVETPPQETEGSKSSVSPPRKPKKAEDRKDSLAYDIPITFTGYLYKLGRGFSCWTWNLRYIIVCGFNLYYFDKKNDMRPKDTISIKNSRIRWHGPHMSRPYVFSITTESKEVYYWSADEDESVKRWVLLLQVLCEESPPSIVKQLAYELTYHQKNSENPTNVSPEL